MDDLERLEVWLYQWLSAKESKHEEERTEMWNRLCRQPHSKQAAADYVAALAAFDDFSSMRDELWEILAIFRRR